MNHLSHPVLNSFFVSLLYSLTISIIIIIIITTTTTTTKDDRLRFGVDFFY